MRDSSRDLQFIDALKKERMKTWAVRDAQQRVIILYEAVVNSEEGDDCLATVYYYESNNAVPTASKEVSAKWSDAWDVATDAIVVNS